MKTKGVKMDMENDTANIVWKDVALNLVTSGYYCIPIHRTKEIPVEEVLSVKLEVMDSKYQYETNCTVSSHIHH